jgi:hypothetical protein
MGIGAWLHPGYVMGGALVWAAAGPEAERRIRENVADFFRKLIISRY